MTQLILSAGEETFSFPESQKDGYAAWEEDLTEELVMISGRMVKELRGVVWRIRYQYGWFNDEERKKVIALCRAGKRTPLTVTFLPPDGDELITGTFWVTAAAEPKFMWSRDGKPLWGDFSVELREVYPHAG